MTCGGVFYLNSAPLQEHDFLVAPLDLELQQVSGELSHRCVLQVVQVHMCPAAT